MKAVLLVGGEGTRLRPLTHDLPKPLFPIAGVPYLQQLVHYLLKFDVHEMILTSCYLSEQIQEFCKETQESHFKLIYVLEESPLGTGGAVGNVEEHLEETFLVLNGDILTDFDLGNLIKLHQEKKAGLTIGLTPVEDPSRYGVALLTKESQIRQFIEKPKKEDAPTPYINAGIYVVEPRVLKDIPKGQKISIEREIFPKLASQGRLYGSVLTGYWLDMGTPSDYLQAHHDFLDQKISLLSRTVREGPNWKGSRVKIDAKAKLIPPVLLGDNCVAKAGAVIGPHAVLGKGCVVEEGARIERSVLWDGVRVGKKCKVEACIAGSGATIKMGEELENQMLRSVSIDDYKSNAQGRM